MGTQTQTSSGWICVPCSDTIIILFLFLKLTTTAFSPVIFFFFPYQCAKERQLPTSGDRGPSGTDKLQSKISVSTTNRHLRPHALVPKASLVYPSLCSSPYSGFLSLSILTTISSFCLIRNCEQHYIHGNSLLPWAPLKEAESWWSVKLVECLDDTVGIRDQAWMSPGR